MWLMLRADKHTVYSIPHTLYPCVLGFGQLKKRLNPPNSLNAAYQSYYSLMLTTSTCGEIKLDGPA